MTKPTVKELKELLKNFGDNDTIDLLFDEVGGYIEITSSINGVVLVICTKDDGSLMAGEWESWSRT